MPSGRSFHLAGDRYLRISAAGESGDVVTLLRTGLIGTADCEVSPEAAATVRGRPHSLDGNRSIGTASREIQSPYRANPTVTVELHYFPRRITS
jgi:hypothetical protein